MSEVPCRTFRRVCVYGGSSSKVSAEYLSLAASLGRCLARRKLTLVFGGGKVGLMGAVADAALAEGGEVIGVMPRSLVDKELAHTGCTSLHIVESMHERKAAMAQLADAFVAMPGGWGTLEEIAEVTTWTQLNIHLKPVGLLNSMGYWDDLMKWTQNSCKAGFMSETSAAMLCVAEDGEALLAAMATSRLPDAEDKLRHSMFQGAKADQNELQEESAWAVLGLAVLATAALHFAELRWQPPQLPAPSEPLPLKEGQSVTVGKMQLQVREAIGSGAYAQVWAATTEDGREVAVKEMRCGVGAGILPDASVQRAVHEVKVMRLLTEACEGELRVPKLLQHQFWDLSPAEPGAYVLRVAMLRRQGRAVIDFLQEREMSAELAAMGRGPPVLLFLLERRRSCPGVAAPALADLRQAEPHRYAPGCQC
ncbi:unnamed protein product [Effrenium voratum]|uniref:Cytokinin riboside 5'-monophosphate phosphoribohydrolase n=1 Tax=Effrenium voratum TaxID=2562239 RepID=A0AA36MWN3_9DINO|nr:unnamed protein product [Effrenium voratum]